MLVSLLMIQSLVVIGVEAVVAGWVRRRGGGGGVREGV